MINQNWVFGRDCGLDFSTPIPTPVSGFLINTLEGCASISDSSGNLLFYTDGQTIWDNLNTPQVTGLLGHISSTQSAIIVPDPSNNQQYYVFTSSPSNHFNGGLINTSTTSWSFTLLSDLMTLPNTSGLSHTEKVTAIQHDNCKDFWIITILQEEASGLNGIIRIFRVNSSGVEHYSDTDMNLNVNDVGYMKGSPTGEKIAIVNYQNSNIYVYPFNKSTGEVDTNGILNINASTTENYGAEFSPNETLLYYDDYSSGTIYQVDLTDSLLNPILVGDLPTQAGALQLGIDNRIYIAKMNENSLGAILNPDVVGSGCNVTNTFITLLSGSQCKAGLPNLIQNICEEDCSCSCTGCNKEAEEQNEELIDRANTKFNTIKSNDNCSDPFSTDCKDSAIHPKVSLEPCFYFHWGDNSNDQIEEHDTEVFYLTVCNKFRDIQYNGLRITKVNLIPDTHSIEKIQIVPDRFISMDCLLPCSCQTREFALITRANDTAGNYMMEIEYCYESVSLTSGGENNKVTFPIMITED